LVKGGEFGGRGVRRNVPEEDGEGGATAVQCGVRGDWEGEGDDGLHGRGGDDPAAAKREERRGDSQYQHEHRECLPSLQCLHRFGLCEIQSNESVIC